MPELVIENVRVADLIPYAANARLHSKEQVDQIAASIAEFGFNAPVLIDADGVLIAGHGRVLAAMKMGMAEVPAIRLGHLTEAQARAYRLADNAIALNSKWDDRLLAAELKALSLVGFPIGTIGLANIDLERLSLAPPKGDIDAPPPPLPTAPTARLGDVWLLGRHRLVCGDSTSPEVIAKASGGKPMDMLLTDPPYCSGGFQEAGKSSGSVGTRGTEMVANDTLSTRGYMALMRAVIPNLGVGVAYVFTDWRMWINLFDVIESSGFGVRNMIVWDKGTPGMGAGWRMQHELIMCGIKVKSPFNPKKAQGNVIQAKRTGNKLHATEKPASLLVTIIEVTDMAKVIVDPFCGSGTTIVAAEATGRSCRAIELTPGYADVSVLRWQALTGEAATLEGDGRTFEQIAAARKSPAAAVQAAE